MTICCPMVVPISTESTSLLHFDGADASTTFTDEKGHTWTKTGAAELDTAALRVKFGTASGLFTGGYLEGDGSSVYAFGTGDFTIDYWIQLNVFNTFDFHIDFRAFGASAGANRYPVIFADSGNHIVFADNSGVSPITSTDTISSAVDTFFHIALTRSAAQTRLFINGVQQASTFADTNSYLCGASRPVLGIDAVNLSSNPINGWYDELRIIAGRAAWTSNFTPPSSPYTS